ncbi:MAG: fatty acid CoA ligase family protein [Planctomycetota bacterium]
MTLPDTTVEPRNVAAFLAERARLSPTASAVLAPRAAGWRTTSFAELDARADAIAHGLAELGLAAGERTALLLPPGPELVAAVFALFRLGAVPVVADPGRGATELARSLARVRPRAFLGTPAAHLFRKLHERELGSVEIALATGRGWLPGVTKLDAIARPSLGRFEPVEPGAGAEAAILFTSGSTGPAKGVVYTHAHFLAQLESLRALYGFAEGEIDLACFPLFALFAPALGMACAFPKLDPRRPGDCDPAEIVRAADQTRATTTFGSPAIWRRVVPWARERGVRLATVRRVLVAGAPVPPELVEGLLAILPDGAQVHTPYGQTEALPLASISGAEILARRGKIEGGFGHCVGRPAPGIELAVLRVEDGPIARWSDDLRLPVRSVGELAARGAVVTCAYAEDPDATAAAKIGSGSTAWHRTGDLGYFDDEGMLWFCGRKSHRLETERGLVAPVPAENLLNRHPRVARTALVGLGARGREVPVAVVEPKAGEMPRSRAERERFGREVIEQLARRLPDAPPRGPGPIERVLFHKSFPVDARHNAKIRSEELRRWAEEQAG